MWYWLRMKTRAIASILVATLVAALFALAEEGELPKGAKRIHVFVALCDNDSQGIVRVGEKIGNGDDPEANLYWGCDDGLKSYFSRSSKWKLISKQSDVSEQILRRYIFEHKVTRSVLVADAYRGSEIRTCLEEFLRSSEGTFEAVIEVKEKGELAFGGAADLIAYLGHNGLMEHKIEPQKQDSEKVERDAVVLCCVSNSYFGERLMRAGTRPVLMTDQLMYPGSFALHEGLEAWFKDASRKAIREGAALAMAKNQKISVKAARGIFSDLEGGGKKK